VRSLGRAILTPNEAEQLKKSNRGLMGCDKDTRRRIKDKTLQAMINDLPLIFKQVDIKQFFDYDFFEPNAYPYREIFLKNLIIYCYKQNEYYLTNDRRKKGSKQKVAFREAWKPIKEIIDEAKTELRPEKRYL
jgi:hypothetical protein